MSLATAKALRAARARIDTEAKWCKDRMHMGPDVHCAEGACVYVPAGTYVNTVNALRAALALMPAMATCDSIMSYNDLPTTTHADIMALFDRAIKNEDETV